MGISRAEFSRAYHESHTDTIHFLMAKGVSEQLAEDAAQAAWARGWEKRDSLRQVHRIAGWINSIALNIFRNSYRREKRLDPLPEPGLAAQPPRVGSRVDLQRGLKECATQDRRLLGELYLAGYSSLEIGRRRGLKPSTVRVRAYRARQRLRELLAGDGCDGRGPREALGSARRKLW